jgi:hypothetical protein
MSSVSVPRTGLRSTKLCRKAGKSVTYRYLTKRWLRWCTYYCTIRSNDKPCCKLYVARARYRATLCVNRNQPSKKKNHGTQDSRVVPHRGTNWAALRLTAQIERDAVLSKSYGRGY